MHEALRPGRVLGIFHFLSKLWVQKLLTGRATKEVTRPEKQDKH